MRNRGIRLLVLLLALLLAVLAGYQFLYLPNRVAEEALPPEALSQALLDSIYDRIGVTRWAEALAWYQMYESGALDVAEATDERPVWVSRSGHRHFHSIPVCGGMRSPVEMTLGEADSQGFVPCPLCWVTVDRG